MRPPHRSTGSSWRAGTDWENRWEMELECHTPARTWVAREGKGRGKPRATPGSLTSTTRRGPESAHPPRRRELLLLSDLRNRISVSYETYSHAYRMEILE